AKLEPGAADGTAGASDASGGGTPIDEALAETARLVERAQEVLTDMRGLQSRIRQYEPQSEVSEELRERLREVATEFQVLRGELATRGLNPDGSPLRRLRRAAPMPQRVEPTVRGQDDGDAPQRQ
ncbi:MAG: hypothetical protein ACOC0P_01840, partial [Planctomycetota bacterium]